MWNCKREYRVTRNASGIRDIGCRQGYYIRAYSVWDAIETMGRNEGLNEKEIADERWNASETEKHHRWVSPRYTIQLWR